MYLKQKFRLSDQYPSPAIQEALQYAIDEDPPREENFKTIPTKKFQDSKVILSYFGVAQLYKDVFEEFLETNHSACTYLMISGTSHNMEFRRIGDRLMECKQFFTRMGARPSVDPNEKVYSFMQRKYLPSDFTYNVTAVVPDNNSIMAMNKSMENQSRFNMTAPTTYFTISGLKHKLGQLPEGKRQFGCVTILGLYDDVLIKELVSHVMPFILPGGILIMDYLQEGFQGKLNPTEEYFKYGTATTDPELILRTAFDEKNNSENAESAITLRTKVIPEVHGIFGLAIGRIIDTDVSIKLSE